MYICLHLFFDNISQIHLNNYFSIVTFMNNSQLSAQRIFLYFHLNTYLSYSQLSAPQDELEMKLKSPSCRLFSAVLPSYKSFSEIILLLEFIFPLVRLSVRSHFLHASNIVNVRCVSLLASAAEVHEGQVKRPEAF